MFSCLVVLPASFLATWITSIVTSSVVQCYGFYFRNNDDDDDDNHVIKASPGIDPSVLQAIPVIEFDSKDFKDGDECVVCLSEFADGDKARVLPSCNHLFHASCIDAWLKLKVTCPICRTKVEATKKEL